MGRWGGEWWDGQGEGEGEVKLRNGRHAEKTAEFLLVALYSSMVDL